MDSKIIVTEISEGIVFYPELANWIRSLDEDPDDENFEPLSLMEGDPDILRCNGHESYFIDTKIGDVKYILTSTEVDDLMKIMLERFNDDYFDHHFQSMTNTWESFRSEDYAVAYRGGKGYEYSMWKFEPGM